MDEMRINLEGKFMTRVISKIAMKIIKKKIGYNVDIRIHKLSVDVIDGIAHMRTDIEMDMDQKEFKSLLKDVSSDEGL